MNNRFTLGQYYRADSVIHRLDPRTKLAGTLLYVISLFFPAGMAGLGLAAAALWLIMILSRVPGRLLIRGLRPLRIIILFTAAANLFFTQGTVLWAFGIFKLTEEGIRQTVYILVRLLLLIAGSSIMTYTTSPGALADGLEKGLSFLTLLKVPVHEFAMTISIAMRFIPILTEEFGRIRQAQMARGADFESGNLIERGRKLIPVLVPLFISAMRRASDLAVAMDARCYIGGQGRTKLHPLQYGRRDGLAYGLIAVYLCLMVWLCFDPWHTFNPILPV